MEELEDVGIEEKDLLATMSTLQQSRSLWVEKTILGTIGEGEIGTGKKGKGVGQLLASKRT